jgi:hypothetical protein
MRYAPILVLSALICGCAEKTYYACRDGGNSREFCSGLADAPTGGVLAKPGPVVAVVAGMQTASLETPRH